MPENLKTPGVYVAEKDTGANAIVQVSTAVPAFIGFTEKAEVNGKPFHMKPVHITSLSEYEVFFGGPPVPVFSMEENNKGSHSPDSVSMHGKNYTINQSENTSFMLYNSLKLFFDNGGADCFIVSIGQYGKQAGTIEIIPNVFKKGVDTLAVEETPTMLLMPQKINLLI